MGTPEFAVPSLEALLNAGHDVTAVVTGVDKPRGRGQEVLPTAVKQFALARGVRVLQPSSLLSQEFVEHIRALQPDLIIVVAFRILPPRIFDIPRLGSFNLHASFLPKYRGAAPIQWAIMNGETETGLTTFLLQEKVDTGMILCRRHVPILPEDDSGLLHDRLALEGAGLVVETARLLEQGEAHPVAQDDSEATPAPKIHPEDCRIDWSKPAGAIHNKIRALSPHPGARTTLNNRLLKVYKSKLLKERSRGAPGLIRISGEDMSVSTGDTLLSLVELQQEGRKRMSVGEFLRGRGVEDGAKLT
jgi:methionyl-tRNA formyltransferase